MEGQTGQAFSFDLAGKIAGLLKIAALVLFGFLVFSAAVVIGGHRFIIKHWPEAQSFYIEFGLAKDPLKDNLVLQNILSERRYVDGAMQLVITGEIHSHAQNRQVVPAIVIEAIGADEHIIESWRIDPPKATMDPNMTVPFSAMFLSPETTVVDVNLSFVEPPHDEE
ncbi:MAG: hypothetical protein AB7E52_05165 [Bdellovibrionales bacterium]